MNKKILLSVILAIFLVGLVSASTTYVSGYISNADDGTSPDGMTIKVTNELGEVQYDRVGITGNSKNYNQFKVYLQGELTLELMPRGDYYSESVNFKTTTNKYDFIPGIKLLKETSFSKLGYEPFTISEQTEYGFNKNTIYVNVTNNMPTDESINIYHIFSKNDLTNQIKYDSIEILEEFDIEVFEDIITETEVFSELDVEYIPTENETELLNLSYIEDEACIAWNKHGKCTKYEKQKKYYKKGFYDKKGNQLDSSKIKEKTIYNNETGENSTLLVEYNKETKLKGYEKQSKYDDKTRETIFRAKKPLTNNPKYWKQEYKHSQENIDIKAGETISVRLTYFHAPILQQNIPTDEENKYDIEVCTINKEFCTILDPTWYNESWGYYKEYTNLTGNITYMEINQTVNDNADWNDTRFISCYDETLVFNHTLEAEIGTLGQFRVNNLGENCTLRYYGNAGATSTSNASDVYFNPVFGTYFDGNTNDFIGSNDGTISGAVLGGGYINQSYYFDGNDKITYPNILNGNLKTTMCAWVNVTSGRENVILGQRDSVTSAGFFIFRMRYGKINYYDYSGGFGYDASTTSNTVVENNTFNFVCFTKDGTSGTFYLNGVSDGTSTAASLKNYGTDTLVVGIDNYNGGSAGDAMIGSIDEILIFNRLLSSDEIYSIYTQTAPNIIEGSEQSQSVDISIIPPTWETQSGQTSGNLTFLQTTKYINTTSVSNVSYMTLTITDPDSIVSLTENMTNTSLEDWYSATAFSFDKVGTWNLEVEGFKDGSSATNSTTLEVEITAVSTKDGWFGCSKNKILSSAEIDTLITYDCDLVELSENATDYKTNNETLKTAINDSKNRFIKTGINIVLDFDLNSTTEKNSALINVSNVLSDFTIPPYTDAIEYISLEIKNSENYNTSIKNSVINEFAENLTSSVENQFVIYSKNYNNASLDSSYISFTSFFYLDNSTESSLMEQENIILRGNSGLNRMYVNLNDTLMLQTQSYQNNILDNLRGTPTGSTTIPTTNVAEINSDINDIVVFNKESTNQSYSVNVTPVTEMLTKDVWDSGFGYLVEKDTDGIFTINVTPYTAHNIFMDNFSHIQYGDTESTLFKESISAGGHSNYTNGTKYDIYGMYGANDASIEIWDSTYKSNTFIDYYGWFNVSSVTNWSRYDIVIFDDENPTEVASILSETEAKGTRLFGYVAVADYENTDAWYNGKKAEIDVILALNESTRMNIFIDGLDYQVAGVNFSSRMKDLVDYIKIENNRDVGLNTYTAYQDFCSWSKPGGFCMRESCVRRWDGTVGDPTYSWENWTLELEKSAWFNSHGVQVMCQSFGNKTTSGENRIENHTILQDTYFASLILGYTDFYMSQPDFQYAHEINLYDVGSDLANTYSTDDDETYYRRYANGIVYYNTSSHKGWIEDGREFDGISMCFNLIDANDAVDAEGINFAFNINEGSYYEIPATEIIWSADGNWYCKDINSTDYSEDGYYYVKMKPHDRNPTSGNAIYLSNSINQDNTGRHSFWDNTAGGDPYAWNAYEQDRNWMVDLEINQTKSTSSDTTGIITQTNVSDTFQTNLTLSSPYHQDIEVRSTFIEQDMTNFGNLSYWNGTESINLNYVNNTDCSSISPTWNTTTINGEIHKACISDTGFRIATPHLSTQVYILDLLITDILAPELNILYPVNTTYLSEVTEFNFSVNDTDDNLDSCWYSVNDSLNISTSCASNITGLSSVEGLKTWTIYANDTYGNENYSSVSFTIDTTSPTITILNPIVGVNEKTQPVEFKVNLSEDGSCYMTIYNTNYTMTSSDNRLFTYSKILEIGLNSAEFFCTDNFSNSANSSITFNLDPTSTGGGGSSQEIIEEVPVEPTIEPEVIQKETTVEKIINTVVNNTENSVDVVKESVMEDWEWYLVGAGILIIFIIGYLFFKD